MKHLLSGKLFGTLFLSLSLVVIFGMGLTPVQNASGENTKVADDIIYLDSVNLENTCFNGKEIAKKDNNSNKIKSGKKLTAEPRILKPKSQARKELKDAPSNAKIKQIKDPKVKKAALKAKKILSDLKKVDSKNKQLVKRLWVDYDNSISDLVSEANNSAVYQTRAFACNSDRRECRDECGGCCCGCGMTFIACLTIPHGGQQSSLENEDSHFHYFSKNMFSNNF